MINSIECSAHRSAIRVSGCALHYCNSRSSIMFFLQQYTPELKSASQCP